MSSKSEGRTEDPSHVLQVILQQFEQVNDDLQKIKDKLDRRDVILANLQRKQSLQVPNARRQKNYDPFPLEEFDERDFRDMGRFMPRGDLYERRPRRNPRGRDGIDRNLGSSKMNIPTFQERNAQDACLEWKKNMELIFDYLNYSEERTKRGGDLNDTIVDFVSSDPLEKSVVVESLGNKEKRNFST